MRKTKFSKQGKLNHFFVFDEKVVPLEAKNSRRSFWPPFLGSFLAIFGPFLGSFWQNCLRSCKNGKNTKGRGRDLKCLRHRGGKIASARANRRSRFSHSLRRRGHAAGAGPKFGPKMTIFDQKVTKNGKKSLKTPCSTQKHCGFCSTEAPIQAGRVQGGGSAPSLDLTAVSQSNDVCSQLVAKQCDRSAAIAPLRGELAKKGYNHLPCTHFAAAEGRWGRVQGGGLPPPPWIL